MARSDVFGPDLDFEVAAGGGVLIRRSGDGDPEIAVIHRPRYMDWSLPKGKLDPGEGWLDAALREVEEETGFQCRAGVELTPVTYRDRNGRRKLVRYWLMSPVAGGFVPDDEVDELRWLSVTDALEQLTYEHDRGLVREALARRR